MRLEKKRKMSGKKKEKKKSEKKVRLGRKVEVKESDKGSEGAWRQGKRPTKPKYESQLLMKKP